MYILHILYIIQPTNCLGIALLKGNPFLDENVVLLARFGLMSLSLDGLRSFTETKQQKQRFKKLCPYTEFSSHVGLKLHRRTDAVQCGVWLTD